MINLKEVTFSNFMSFGKSPTTVNLDTNLATLILGKNEDNGKSGYSKNGVGKTTLFQAVSYVIFGDTFANIKQDDFINVKNKKKMWVSLTFERDGVIYTIKRGRKPLVLEVTKNGSPFTLHSASNEDESIRQLFGMDLMTFNNTYMLTNNINGFMNLKPAAQKAFFESLIKIDLLSKRATSLKTAQKEVVVDIRLEEQKKANIEQNNKKNESYIQTLEQKSEKWESEKSSGLSTLQEEYDVLVSVDIEDNLKRISILEELENDLDTVSTKIESLHKRFESKTRESEKYHNELHSLESGSCPYCDQTFIDKDKTTEVKNICDTLSSEIDDIANELTPLLQEEDDIKDKIDVFISQNNDLLKVKECEEIINKIERIEEKMESVRTMGENPYNEQIELLKKNIEEYDYTNLTELSKLESHYKILVKLLTDNKSFIRKNIVDQYVPFFNDIINKCLEDLESPNRVIINNDLTFSINYMHTNLSFGNLSTGERIRVTFAISMAFREFVNMTGNGLNVLFIDEIFDSGLDLSGFHSITNMLKKNSGSTFIISHKDELIPEVDETMVIVKSGGFSSIQ